MRIRPMKRENSKISQSLRISFRTLQTRERTPAYSASGPFEPFRFFGFELPLNGFKLF